MKQKTIRIPFPWGKTLAFQFRAWYARISTHTGVTNETFDGYYLPFWDFAEEFKLRDILYSLKYQQDEFGLGDIFVFQSFPSESYRAVCFDKMVWTRSIAVIASAQCLDDRFLRFSLMRGRFVLRLTDKKDREEKLIHWMKAAIPDNTMPSLDHQAFFSSKYPQIPKPIPYPQKINVRLSQYESFR